MKKQIVKILLKGGGERRGRLVHQSYYGLEIMYGDGTIDKFKTDEMARVEKVK